jgi:hypothetical protein
VDSWVDSCVIPFAGSVKGDTEKALLLMDHLHCQKKMSVVSKLHAHNIECAYGPKYATEAWQPCDAGHVGGAIKALCRDLWDRWLDAETVAPGTRNYDLYINNKLTASQKRIAFTHLIAESWDIWSGSQYDAMRMSSFVSAGAAITTTKTNDHRIQVLGADHAVPVPEGLFLDMKYINTSYSMAPLFFEEVAAAAAAAAAAVPEAAALPEEDMSDSVSSMVDSESD